MSERMKLPKIGDELYEHYPSMSAQTHGAEVKRYAKSCLELMRAEQASVVTALQQELAAAEARANAAEQRLKEAVKVLEPFASVIEDYDPWKEGDDTQGTLVIGSVTDYRLTLGDLRAARAFIKEAGE